MNYRLLCKVIAAPILVNTYINCYLSDEEQFIDSPLKASLIYSCFSMFAPLVYDSWRFGIPSYKDNLLFSAISIAAAAFSYAAVNNRSILLAIPATALNGVLVYQNCIGAFSYFDDD